MLVLIDGHNLIGKMPGISLADVDDEDRLLVELRRYRARSGRKIVVVFDAGVQYQASGKQTKGGITVQFAPHGKTADQVIIRRVEKAKNPRQILVVSSDRSVVQAVKRSGADVIASEDFAAQLTAPPPASKTGPPADADVTLSDDEIADWMSIFGEQDEP